MSFDVSSFIAGMVLEDLPANQFRGLDGQAYPFVAHEAQPVAMSSHDPMFKTNANYGWGTRWFAVHWIDGRYVLTVGHGMWCARREVPAEAVPEVLSRYFCRSELAAAGQYILSLYPP
jgi:hypothetical protein